MRADMATTKKTTEVSSADAAKKAEGAAEQRAEAEENQIDETVPGGRYIVDGQTVNSEGQPVK
jgi:hypothetical protein